MQDRHIKQVFDPKVAPDEGLRWKHASLGTTGARACIELKNGPAAVAEAKDLSEGPRPSQHRRINQLGSQGITVATSDQLWQTHEVLDALPAT